MAAALVAFVTVGSQAKLATGEEVRRSASGVPFVIRFRGSVRGLAPGAPVEVHGIRIGDVLTLGFEYDSKSNGFVAPVEIEIQPSLFPASGPHPHDAEETYAAADVLVRRGILVSALLPFSVVRCGSPPTRVFDLSSASAAPASSAAANGPLIYVDKPSVAAYFDRTQMVTRKGDSRVSIHEFEIWSDPPAELIARALVDDLARRFGADRVMTTPTEQIIKPDWRVQLDVMRFDVEETWQAVLDARWTLLAGSQQRLAGTRRIRIDVPVADVADPQQRVVGLRQAVAILANHIGEAIAETRVPGRTLDEKAA